jgi:hypothetical protein
VIETLNIDPAVALIFRLLLALVFASAVLHKLIAPRLFRAAVRDYQMLPDMLVTPVAAGFILMECTTALALVVPVTAPFGVWGAAGLLLVYTGAIAFNLLRGRTHIDCGCMGPAHVQQLNAWLLLRNLPLLIMAWAAGLPVYDRGLLSWDYVTVIAAVMALGMLYVTMNQLLINAPGLRALLLRHD